MLNDRRVAARGVWLYNGTAPHTIEVYARLAKFGASRFREPDEHPETPDEFVLDESAPIADMPDGLLYYVGATKGGEFHTVEEAKKWADAQPWGPENWGSPGHH